METQVSNIFLSIQNQKRSPWVVDHPDFLSRENCKECTKFVAHQLTQGSKVHHFLFKGFRGHFYKITPAPFHLCLKIRKSHGNTGF